MNSHDDLDNTCNNNFPGHIDTAIPDWYYGTYHRWDNAPMAAEFSTEELLKFLDYLREKGLMKPATIASRKAAVNNVLGILSAEEAEDLRELDIDEVAMRFSNLKGSGFKPESIRVYKSRVASSLQDFINYRKNPMAFKPSGSAPRTSTPQKDEKDAKKRGEKQSFETANSLHPSVHEVTFPIPIRPNLVVKLVGLPGDLTNREATKIANVVMALAQDAEK